MPDQAVRAPTRDESLGRVMHPAKVASGPVAFVQGWLKWGFEILEYVLDRIFGPAWNPLYQLGALGFFYYWVVVVSGIYVYIFFDTGTTEAYDSVEYLTVDQWYLGGVMRSLHRYASDGMILMMVVHMLREFALDRYRGSRWFTWVTGTPILWFVFVAGITGYWMVWDQLAQYIAIASTEWLDWLGIFGEAIARNFLTPSTLDDRFFTLLTFIHIVVPLLLLLVLWIHLQRVTKPRINPKRGLAAGTFLMLVALSFVKPAVSHPPADLTIVPGVLKLDWFYLPGYPLMDYFSNGAVWAFAGVLTFMLFALPWLPPVRRPAVAAVNLNNCNGCERCANDCPFNAIVMRPRSDALPFEHEATVDAPLCVGCGICAGACPTSTPFRRASELTPGIDLPDRSLRDLRDAVETVAANLSGESRVIVFGCDHAVALNRLAADGIGTLSLPCIAALPPSFIDYVLSRDLADGVVITGCRDGECFNRFGVDWMTARLAGERDPYLRKRVPRERIFTCWAAGADRAMLAREIEAFRQPCRPCRCPASHRPDSP
jgi:quinol-cytochrome oxidoreductase complex cytochrome b subunit/coenzyme F420-reducing hydrogenase delta subunit/ferredoxin